MRNHLMLGGLFIFAVSAQVGVAQQKNAASVAVIIDSSRGALVRWGLPVAGVPKGGFEVARSVNGGAAKVIATVRPGDPKIAARLTPAQLQLGDKLLAANPAASGKNNQSNLAMQLLTLADPDLAAYLALSYEDREIPSSGTVAYTISAVTADGHATTHGFSLPTPVMNMPPPSPPADLRATVSRDGVALFWSPAIKDAQNPAGAVTYEIQRVEGNNAVPITPKPVLRVTTKPGAVEPPGAIDKKPAIESNNAYTITALDLFGRRGPRSAPLRVFFPDYSALDPPTLIQSATSEGNVTLTWTAAANRNRKGWKVVRAMQPEAVGEPVATPSTATVTDMNVKTGATYYYRVSAINARGEEGEPATSRAVLVRSGKAPPTPSNLAAQVKTGRVILTWAAPTEAVAAFQIERSIEGEKWNLLTRVATAEPRYEDVYPRDATGSFQYRVTAWAFDDTPSLPSAPIRVDLPDTKPPLAPIVNAITGDDGRVTIDFSPGGGKDDAAEFVVLRSDTFRDSGAVVNRERLTAGHFVDSSVEAGRTYFYRLIAIDATGNRSTVMDPPAVIRVAAPALPSPPVPKARFEAKPFPRVVVEFAASNEASVLYALERQGANGKWMMVQGPFPPETSSAIDANPPRDGRAVYRLVTIAANGATGPRSATVEVSIPRR